MVTRTVPVIACDGAARPTDAASTITAAQQERFFLIRPTSLSGRSKLRRRRAAIAEFRQRLGAHEFQALHGIVAMDLLHIELTHEVDRLLGDDLSRHHDREAWRVWNDEARGNEVGTSLQTAIDLGIAEADIFAAGRV